MSITPQKVPVFLTVASAYTFLFQNFVQILLCVLAGFTVLIAGVVVPVTQLTLPVSAIVVLANVVFVFAFAPVAILVHRSIILEEKISIVSYFQTYRAKRAWLFVALVMLITATPNMIFYLVGIPFGVSVALLVGVIGLALFLFRFSFAIPASATDHYAGLGEARDQMDGCFFRTLAAFIVASVPAIALILLIAVLIGGFSQLPLVVVDRISNFIGIAFSVSLYPAILSYAWLRGGMTSDSSNITPADRVRAVHERERGS